MEVTAITNYFQPVEKQKHSKKLRKWKTLIQNQIQEKSWTSC